MTDIDHNQESPREKTRVCHITTIHPVNDVRIFQRECRSLTKAGYEVHLVGPCDQSGMCEGVHIHSIPRISSRILRMLFGPWRAMFKALSTKSEIYHYHDPEFLFMGFILRWIFGKKVVYDIHESVQRQILGKHYLPGWLAKILAMCYKFSEKLFIKGQVLVLANSGSVPDYPPSAYLVQNYPYIDEDMISRALSQKTDNEVPLLIYVGGVEKNRGSEIYVELAGRLHQRGYGFRMLIVGPDYDGSTERLKPRIKELGIEEALCFSGSIDNKEAMKMVAGASIGLCLLLPIPNYTLCLSTKILEYMMFGKAVLASDFDCWRKYIEGEGTGLMVDPCDLDEVTEACIELLSDEDKLRAMGRLGMKAAREKYNWNSEFMVLLECYRDILNR